MCVYADSSGKKNCGREIENIFSEKKELYSLGGEFLKTELPSPDYNIDIILVNLSLIQSDFIVIGGPKRELLFKGIKRKTVSFLKFL